MSFQPRTEAEIAIQAISGVIKSRLTRPVYVRLFWDEEAGRLQVEQVEYLTTEEFAALVKADKRTVYTWFEKRLLPFYKPNGTGQNLIDINDALAWISAGKVTKTDG
jgi:excisionase family DNA binding protein